jgi:hypothetical protein
VFTPGVPNPLNDESEHERRLAARDFGSSRKWRWVFVGGVLALVAFGVFAVLGFPGAGVILVPVGMGMILGSGIQLLLDRG